MTKIIHKFFLLSLLLISSIITAQNENCNVYELLPPIIEGQMSNDDSPSPCGFIDPDSGVYINQCSPCGRKISDDDCTATPNPTICELDGFRTTTSGFSPDVTPLGVGFCNGAGTIENNFWVGFTAQTNMVSLAITIDQCTGMQGIQVAIVETNCIDQFTTMEGPNPCNFSGINNNTDILTATNLVPGNPYYIMFDGFAGDICEILIEVLDGFETPEYDIVITPPGQLCPDVINPGSFTAEAGSGAQVVVNTGGIATTDLTFYWIHPNGDLMATTNPDQIVGTQVYGSLPSSFFGDTGTYTVEIIDSGSCCPLCATVPLEISNPPSAGAAIVVGLNGEDELNNFNEMIELEGNPDDGSVPAAESWIIVDASGDRQQLEAGVVNTTGRINEYTLARATIEQYFPGQDVGVATLLYGYIESFDQICFGNASVEVPFNFGTTSSSSSIIDEASIDISPNPSQAGFHLSFDSHLSLEKVIIYNIQGIRMYEARDLGAESKVYLDPPSLAPGSYLVEAHFKEGVHTQNFIQL